MLKIDKSFFKKENPNYLSCKKNKSLKKVNTLIEH